MSSLQHNSNSGTSDHSCSICGKALSSASSLDRHMLVHSGERPYNCSVCHQTFTTNGNMHRSVGVQTKRLAIWKKKSLRLKMLICTTQLILKTACKHLPSIMWWIIKENKIQWDFIHWFIMREITFFWQMFFFYTHKALITLHKSFQRCRKLLDFD